MYTYEIIINLFDFNHNKSHTNTGENKKYLIKYACENGDSDFVKNFILKYADIIDIIDEYDSDDPCDSDEYDDSDDSDEYDEYDW